MKRAFRWIFTGVSIGVFVLVGGCATTGISSRHTFDNDAPHGLVFAAILYHGVYSANTILIRSMDGKVEKRLRFGEAMVAWPVLPSGDYVTHGYNSLTRKGGMIAEELPPGEYEVHAWTVEGSYPATFGAPMTPGIRFTVESGVATYLGAYEFKHDKIALRVSGASMSLKDEFERDEAVFLQKYARVRPMAIRNGIARYFRVMPTMDDSSKDDTEIRGRASATY